MKNVHEQFREYGRNAKEWLRKCAILLPEIERGRIWEQKGFSSIFEYAAKLAGMSKNQVYSALRVMKNIENKPSLRKVVEEKGINAVKPVISIVTEETATFWAAKALTMSKHSLETYVREYKKDKLCSFGPGTKQHKTVEMSLSQELKEKLDRIRGERSWEETMKELVAAREKLIESEKPEKVEAKSRYIPANIRQHIERRSNKMCEFPNCTERSKILHHTARFSLQKEHNPDTIIALCKGHERLAHQGLIQNEHLSPAHWCIRLEADKNTLQYRIDQMVMKKRLELV